MDKTLQTKFILARYRKIEEGLRQAAWRGCLLLAQSGHVVANSRCPLSRAQRTWLNDGFKFAVAWADRSMICA
jgi:hypothetical protein